MIKCSNTNIMLSISHLGKQCGQFFLCFSFSALQLCLRQSYAIYV